MKTISYNSDVARLCGPNGIIKAVLLNYIYNYYKANPRKGAGFPACISLREFVYQYGYDDKSLWKRSFVHKILKDLEREGHLLIARENNMPVYSVSDRIAGLLRQERSPVVTFDLQVACDYRIHVAIMSRYLLHVISKSPEGEAYNLKVNEMSEVNCLSPAQIYRAIKYLIETKVVYRVKSCLKYRSRSLSLAKCHSKTPKRLNLHNTPNCKAL